MSYSSSSYGQPMSSPSGPPPPPLPKPYSQDPRTMASPVASPPPAQHQLQQQYQQPPVPPHPSQSPAHQQYHQPPPPPLPHQQYQQQPQQQQSSVPITFELPESITKHTTSDLSSLLADPKLLSALAQNHPAYSASLAPLKSQISTNLALTQKVSNLESQVKQLREQTGQLMLQHTSLQTQWRRKQSEMDEALAPWGPRAMYQRLIAGISEQDAILRAVYESFLEGGEDALGAKATDKEVTEWIKRIREGTVVLEKRREMRARWDEGRVGGWR